MAETIQLGLFYLLIYFLINGLDDVGMDLRMVGAWLRGHHPMQAGRLPNLERLRGAPAQRIAIMVPLWKESAVVEAMVESNLRQVDYPNFDFFLGVYPNDAETMAVVERLSARHPRVHVARCGRPGPTSKANCLNFIYRAIEQFEDAHGFRFPVLMLHDAEDLLHPSSLLLVNWYSATHGMVQVPVLPVATPASAWVHGVYCDEFAEFFRRDLSVRHAEGAFLPSNGVGTAFRRQEADALAKQQEGLLFDEESLTEDYEVGLKLYRRGCRQMLLPLTSHYGELLATREYFPQTLRGAVRQRARWISGQSLQSWERNGWPAAWNLSYWFWRDRKGLLGNYLNAGATILLAASLAGMLAPELTGLGPWLWMAGSVPGARILFPLCTLFAVERVAVRLVLVSSVYGWRFALGVPIRMVIGCWLNLGATAKAMRDYAVARWRRKRVGWAKTEHAFPLAEQTVAHAVPAWQTVAVAAGAGETGPPDGAMRSLGVSLSTTGGQGADRSACGDGAEGSGGSPMAEWADGGWRKPVSLPSRSDEVVVIVPHDLPMESLATLLAEGRLRVVYPDGTPRPLRIAKGRESTG